MPLEAKSGFRKGADHIMPLGKRGASESQMARLWVDKCKIKQLRHLSSEFSGMNGRNASTQNVADFKG